MLASSSTGDLCFREKVGAASQPVGTWAGGGRGTGARGFSPAGGVDAYCTRVPLQPGLAAKVTLHVCDDDTALALNSGEVPVLATPRLIALCEEASLRAIEGHVSAGHTTVGMRVQLDHLAPTPVGGEVTADARLDKIEGRRLTFSVSASDDRGLIAAGKVTRVVVDVEKFLDKCS
jgi:fluoroacetyl-CoA thioesterase